MDVVATSEVSISLTLDPSKIWSRDLIDDELDSLVASFGEIAKVSSTSQTQLRPQGVTAVEDPERLLQWTFPAREC